MVTLSSFVGDYREVGMHSQMRINVAITLRVMSLAVPRLRSTHHGMNRQRPPINVVYQFALSSKEDCKIAYEDLMIPLRRSW